MNSLHKILAILLCLIFCLGAASTNGNAKSTDTTPPILTLDQGPSSFTVNTSTVTISGSSNEDGYVLITINGKATRINLQADEKFLIESALYQTDNKISAVAFDKAGNSSDIKSFTVIVRPNAPMMIIDQVSGYTNEKTEYYEYCSLPDANTKYTITGKLSEPGYIEIILNEDILKKVSVKTDATGLFLYSVELNYGQNSLYITPYNKDQVSGTPVKLNIICYVIHIMDYVNIPHFTIDQDDCIVTESKFTITGKINMKSYLLYNINGSDNIKVECNENNSFTFDVDLSEGINSIQAQVFSSESNTSGNTIEIKVLYDAPPVLKIGQKGTIVNNKVYTLTGSITRPGKVNIKLNNGDTTTVDTDSSYYFIKNIILDEGENIIALQPVSLISVPGETTILKVTYTPSAASKNIIVLEIGNPYMEVNGVKQEIDPDRGTSPIILNSRAALPIRAVLEAMGGNVQWDESERKILINYNGIKIELWLDKNIAKVNGTSKQIDTPPAILNDRAFVPVRFVAENLNCEVSWDAAAQKITISYNLSE